MTSITVRKLQDYGEFHFGDPFGGLGTAGVQKTDPPDVIASSKDGFKV